MIKKLQFLSIFITLITFNTINAQIVLLEEDFSTATGIGNNFSLTGWNQMRDSDTSFANGWTEDDNGAFVVDGYNNDGATGAIRVNMTNNVKRDFLLTPFVDLSAIPVTSTITVSWDMSLRRTNSTTVYQEMNAGDEIRLLVSLDGGSTFTSLALFDSTTTIPFAGQTFSVELTNPSYFINNIQFAFYAFEGPLTTLATNVFIDNFKIEDTTSLSTANIASPVTMELYPNPTKDNIHVKGTELSKVELYTILGVKVPVKYANSTIYTSSLASGVYLVKLTDKNGNNETRKFIKK